MTAAKALQLTTDHPLEDQLGCFGYFGFGSGVALALYGTAFDSGSLYCNRCSQATGCWQRHRERVRELFPDLSALADEVARTHTGAEYIHEFLRRSGQEDLSKMTEPYSAVMMGNLDDGAHVATTQRPTDRGERSLTWPLARLS